MKLVVALILSATSALAQDQSAIRRPHRRRGEISHQAQPPIRF